jgi:hypothetical protein
MLQIETLPARFTSEEVVAFQQGLTRYGKQFRLIHETVSPCVVSERVV